MSRTLRTLIEGKAPVSVNAKGSVRETALVMLNQGVSAVLVMDGPRLLGIFSERDALRFFVATRRNPDLTNVGDVMTRDPITVAPEMTIAEARKLMLDKGFRHLPVACDGAIVGVVSLRAIALDQA